jgi:hypothetical protein
MIGAAEEKGIAMGLADIERAALLKCRYAERYDRLGKNWKRGKPEEYAEEQKASSVHTPSKLFGELIERGLLWRPWNDARIRLTDAGREALRIRR